MSVISSRIVLRPGREKSLLRKHPWVFSGAVRNIEGQPKDGDLIRVTDNRGNFLAIGHYFSGNITVKVLSFEDVPIDIEFWKHKVNSALHRRQLTKLFNNESTNAFRLINGEGDDFPGLIADVYDRTLVLQAHSIGMHRMLDVISSAIMQQSFGKIKAVYDKSKESLPAEYAQQVDNRWLIKNNTDVIEILENDMRLQVDVVNGQKTGFFIDQRDNRKLLGEYAMDKSVLNTFCYTGGFSVAAVLGGASQVTSVDVSANAIAMTERNLELNGYSTVQHPCVKDDINVFLKTCKNDFDIVVLDPPAFAKSMAKRHNAIQGYKRLNQLGIERIRPGGLLFTFSCSQVVDTFAFQGAVLSAAIECGRPAKILHRLNQPSDHPVNIFHPEGSYLKGLVLQID
jgi:23S rRNA (cytosine1962-C5)-methyltransferase